MKKAVPPYGVIADSEAGMDKAPLAPTVTPLTSQWRVGPGVESAPIAPGSTMAKVMSEGSVTDELAAANVTVGCVCVSKLNRFVSISEV